MRDLDQFERRLVHGRLERLVAIPVAIRFLHDDAALEKQALEHLGDIEFLVARVADAERDVLEIAEQRHVGDFGRMGHVGFRRARERRRSPYDTSAGTPK